MFAPPACMERLTAREQVGLLAGLGVPARDRPLRREIGETLELVGLADRAGDRVGSFSFGMRQRLALAQALLPTPELLVLDEPTEGLDPLGVLELRELLLRLRDERGTAILLSSHALTEVDRLVDQLLVLREGRTVFRGEPAELRGAERAVLDVEDRAAVDVALRALRDAGYDARPVEGDEACGDASIECPADGLDLRRADELLAGAGARLAGFRRMRPTLERALLERLRDAESEDAP